MPIYEYRCGHCKKKVEILVLRRQEKAEPNCPACGGKNLRRLVSRFVSLKSEEARMESLADPSNLSGLDENDPASMARWLKRMGKELGEDAGSDEIDQMADEIASGKGMEQGMGSGVDDGGGGTDSGELA
jgi:putative FmdB family regulatory protein